MADYTPRPSPWSQHWRHFRMRLLPVLAFMAALGAIALLWERDTAPGGTVAGEVYAPMTMVNSPRAGWLEGTPIALQDKVKAGQELAIIRTVPAEHAKLALAVLQEELRMIRLGVGDPILDQQRNRLSWQSLRRDWMLVRSELASLRVQVRQAEIDQKRYEELAEKGAETRSVYEQARSLYLSLKAEEEEKERLAAEMEATVNAARQNYPVDETNGSSAGIAAAMDWKDAELRQLEAELAPLSIIAPISGRVSQIFQQPGGFVNLGDPILEIRSDQPECVIAYLKLPMAFQPEPGMAVEVISRRGTRAIAGRAEVLDLGPQFSLLPPVFQRALPVTIEERALPVRISLPEYPPLLPGELVQIRKAGE